MDERLVRVLDVLQQRDVPPLNEAAVAALPFHRQESARWERAERAKRARLTTSDPAFGHVSRDDWRWLEAAHLVDLFTVTETGYPHADSERPGRLVERRVEYVQLTELGRRTRAYVDPAPAWAARRAEVAAARAGAS